MTTPAIKSRLERAWEGLQKEARKQGEARVRVELWQTQAPASVRMLEPQVIQRFPIDRDEVAETLVAEWLEVLQISAESCGGKSQFEVSFFLRDECLSNVKVPFVLPPLTSGAPGAVPGAPVAPAFPSTGEQVQLGQASVIERMAVMQMKHNERTQELLLKSFETLFAHATTQITKLISRVEHLEGERTTLIVTHEEMLSTRAEREMLAAQEKASEKRRDEVFAKGLMLGTALLKSLATQGKFAVSLTDRMALKSLVESMTPSQFEAMLAPLSLEQRMLVMEMVNGALEEDGPPPEKPANTVNGHGGGAQA